MIINIEDKKLDLGRILGGIAWPGDNKSGFAVVVGADTFPEIGGRIHHYHLLSEVEDNDTGQLLRKCAELKTRFEVENFYGRYDESIVNYLTFWNRDARDRHIPEFHVYPAPSSEGGKIGYHLNLLRNRLQSARKTLHLLGQSRLPGYLSELPANGAVTINDSQYPAVAALGYAVSTLIFFGPDLNEEDEEYYPHYDRDSITGY